MVSPSEASPLRDPVAVFGDCINQRHEELVHLHGKFAEGMEIVRDLDRVNEILAASERPDLVMTQRVDLMPVESPVNLGHINNFVPDMVSFGVRLFEDRPNWKGEIESEWVGRRPYTENEKAKLFFMGARGGHTEHLAFAAANNVDEAFAGEVLLQTHINQEAFIRMWIILPELTEWLMEHCLEQDRFNHKYINEELYVAYTLMSKLADVGDRGMVKEDGSIDTWHFCH